MNAKLTKSYLNALIHKITTHCALDGCKYNKTSLDVCIALNHEEKEEVAVRLSTARSPVLPGQRAVLFTTSAATE